MCLFMPRRNVVVWQIISAFQATQEGHQRRDKRITMARLESCLWNSSFINCTQNSIDSHNFWSPRPSGTRSYGVLVRSYLHECINKNDMTKQMNDKTAVILNGFT